LIQPRLLEVTSVRNARDLGGYTGWQGRRIKTGRLVRSGKLNRLTDEDERYLRSYGVSEVIDLRTSAEIQREPDRLWDGVQAQSISISSQEVGHVSQELTETKKRLASDQYAGFQHMCYLYREFILNDYSRAQIASFLKACAENKAGALVFHCSEGKDRTGICAVLLLEALGVNPDVIREDYLYSNFTLADYRKEVEHAGQASGETVEMTASMRSMASVANEYLDTALLTIRSEYGTMAAFFEKGLGLGQDWLDALRANYLGDGND
jgi:protein-tyrosine phosphatase